DHVRHVQLRLLPDALPGHARHAAAHLRLHAVHAPEGPPADERVHDDLVVRTGRRAAHPGRELLPFDAARQDRGGESLAGEHPGVADLVPSATRELHGPHPDRLPRALRVQRAGSWIGLLAAERASDRARARARSWVGGGPRAWLGDRASAWLI